MLVQHEIVDQHRQSLAGVKKFVERSAHQLKDGVFFHQIIVVLVDIVVVVAVAILDVVVIFVLFSFVVAMLLIFT